MSSLQVQRTFRGMYACFLLKMPLSRNYLKTVVILSSVKHFFQRK